MNTRKKRTQEEPAWKKRRKELHAEIRKQMIWKYVMYGGLVLLIGCFFFISIRSAFAPRHKKAEKVVLHYAIGRVDNKTISHNDGKTELVVHFQIGKWDVDKTVDRKTFDSLKEGQEFRMSYEIDPFNGSPTSIHDWQPIKYMPDTPSK